jgi:hypothetical protein
VGELETEVLPRGKEVRFSLGPTAREGEGASEGVVGDGRDIRLIAPSHNGTSVLVWARRR